MTAGKTAETKIVVPDGMLKAALGVHSGPVIFTVSRRTVGEILEAALRWLSEHPVVPTVEQFNELHEKWHYDEPGQPSAAIEFQRICHAWMTGMFAAPEPEVQPDLIGIANELTANPHWRSADLYHALLKAFRQGQQSANKTQAAPEVDRIDYYRSTPEGDYAKMEGPVDTMPTVQEIAEAVRPFADVMFKKSPIQERFEADAALKELLVDEQGDREGYYRPSVFNQKLREAYRMGKESAVQK